MCEWERKHFDQKRGQVEKPYFDMIFLKREMRISTKI